MKKNTDHSADKGVWLYCAKCKCETPHEYIEDDPYFKVGLMCRACMMVWQAEDDLTYEDFVREGR